MSKSRQLLSSEPVPRIGEAEVGAEDIHGEHGESRGGNKCIILKRGKQRKRERDRDAHTHTHTETDRQREKEGEKERKRETKKVRDE